MRTYGKSTDEKRSESIAKALVGALRRIETVSFDPELVFNDAEVESHQDSKGVKDAVRALRLHYLLPDGEDD